MMNTVSLMGRIANDLELKTSKNGKTMMTFIIAVNRAKGEADFIRCNAWGKTAEFIKNYFSKGSMIAILGNIHAGNYTDNNGNTRYIMNINAEKVFFTGEKNIKPQQNNYQKNNSYGNNGYQQNYSNNQRNNNYSQNNYCGGNGYGNY